MASSTPAGQEALPMSGHPLASPPPTAGSLLDALRTAGLAVHDKVAEGIPVLKQPLEPVLLGQLL